MPRDSTHDGIETDFRERYVNIFASKVVTAGIEGTGE
jgi:hypothetical protein